MQNQSENKNQSPMSDKKQKSNYIGLAATNELVSALLAGACQRDADLRAMAETDPKKVFSFEGVTLDDKVTVRSVQNTADTVHIVVPCYESYDKIFGSLSDQQLAAISGGDAIVATIIGTIALCVGTLGGIVLGGGALASAAGYVGCLVVGAVTIGLATWAVGAAVGVGIAAGLGAFDSDNSDVSVGLVQSGP